MTIDLSEPRGCCVCEVFLGPVHLDMVSKAIIETPIHHLDHIGDFSGNVAVMVLFGPSNDQEISHNPL